ncbi:inositol hexakisphosphate and diphosphoinositol-pentakisphosphate kinase [Gnomoniopsis smithogilvyi]|uniref:Inositol hexakisphosphate and diphosphoinositol-pentakisphosphate kinase n=1 Tax=Gnomoniopsis smithogilvyi TaxID=1191159 RepID=A0A9W9CVM2_9PEZI|nr:inositol hexakisphosphate and diphosphoinositol-pentakisphosphate kinase [Gnomoniopsis smithogilvyi]
MTPTNPSPDPPVRNPAVNSDERQEHQEPTSHTQEGPAPSRASSISSLRSNSLAQKSKHSEAGITEVHADQASLSMPPPQSRPVRTLRALSQTNRDSNNYKTVNEDAASIRSGAIETGSFRSNISLKDAAAANDSTEDFDTPRLVPGAWSDRVEEQTLPDPAMPSSRSSMSEDNKRMSISSIYSLASARGIPSSAASANGSDTGSAGTPRSVSGLMASSAPKQGSAGGNLAPREHHHLPDMLKRNTGQAPRPDPPGSTRGQPNRDRSRAKRRLSGSTAASSHSPSSDRTLHHKEKDEAKPAPLGIIGVCALDVKARSKPSRNILNRLLANREFDVKIFGDKVILDEDQVGVPTPKRLEVNRDGGPRLLTPEIAKHIKDITGISLEPTPTDPEKMKLPRKVELLDDGDILSVDGSLLKKPFVEKPTSGEDHNIIIYFHSSTGGGARKLFRKIGNKSSEHVEDLNVPRCITQPGESYLYEKFMEVDNAEDVKAYTVGPEYCHAETRKSPVVDGLVRRNTHGKEIRYVTSLSDEEKTIASKIANIFGQRVCGFDLLRAGGKSYVIDVNGWSFVKDNDEYYDRCANILKDIFVKERMRRVGMTPPMPSPAISDVDPMGRSASGGEKKVKETPLLGMLPNQKTAVPASKAPQDTKDSNTPAQEPPKPENSTTPKAGSGPISPLLTQLPEPLTGSLSSSAPATLPATPNLVDLGVAETEGQTPPPPPPKHSWKLKGMVSVIRHADRTPKQKFKFTFHTDPFIELLKGHQEEVLLIGEPALTSVLEAVDKAMRAGGEDREKLRTLRNVLVKKSSWPGTKVQIKPMFRKKKTEEMTQVDEKQVIPEDQPLHTAKGPDEGQDSTQSGNESGKERKPRFPPKRHDSLSGVTMSKITAAENGLVLDKLQLIVKWGGEPTHSARYQAQELGENMRADLEILNREILDEVHVFSSSERRVTTSAQIWSSAFLNRTDLPEDFIQIRKDLLDDSNAAKDEMDKVKKKLKGLLRKGNERPSQFAWPENMPEPSEVQTRVVQLMNFHRRVMQHNYNKLYSGAVTSLNAISNPNSSEKLKSSETSSTSVHSHASALSQVSAVADIQARWCCGEDAELFRERWEKLFTEFCDGEKVDPSKISELYDTMKFDALHNRQFLEWVFTPSRNILEEEFGIIIGNKERAATFSSKDSDEQQQTASKTSEESKNGDKGSVKDAEATEYKKKRLFRRPSWKNGLRGASKMPPPEEYFNLCKGDSQTRTKMDARFEPLRELYQLAKIMFDFICPQEYGISDSEKLEIGLLTSLPLLREIVTDLEDMQASDDAKCFFYFTKESHIYTLLNCILEGGIDTKIKRATIPELDYLSQICFELYESETNPPDAADGNNYPHFEYSIRITISPGCHVYDPLDVQLDSKHCISCAPRRSLTPHCEWKTVIDTLRAKFHTVKLPKSFVAVNLSDAFSLEKQSGDDEVDEGGLEMRLTHARAKEENITAAQGLVSAINEAATTAEDDVPRV